MTDGNAQNLFSSSDSEDNTTNVSSGASESEIDTETDMCSVSSDASFHSEDDTTVSQTSPHHAYFVALLSLATKHKTTDLCTAEVLKLFSAMVPCENPFPTTFYLLIRRFLQLEKEITVHHCCGCCTKLLDNNQHCESVVCKMSGIPNSSFIEVRLDRQLQTLFSGSYLQYIGSYYIFIYTVSI